MFIKTIGLKGTWLQASYNSNFRKNFPSSGYTYDSSLDAFIPPSPYPSWILNTNACVWEPPVPYPNLKESYTWNESMKQWVKE